MYSQMTYGILGGILTIGGGGLSAAVIVIFTHSLPTDAPGVGFIVMTLLMTLAMTLTGCYSIVRALSRNAWEIIRIKSIRIQILRAGITE